MSQLVSTTKANGVNLYYELNGNHGEPVVLVHGSWSDHHSWGSVVPGLSGNFRVLTFDRRGHGKSERTNGQGSAEEDAADTADLMTRLGLVPAHIVGTSFGGSIALKLAARQPSIFRSLIVHEPPLFELLKGDAKALPILLEGRKRIEEAVDLLESGDRPGGARLFAESLTIGPGAWEKMSERARETMVANSDTWLDETRDPEATIVNLPALSRFSKPTLLTYGGKGMHGSGLIIEKLAGTIPNSRIEFYPDQGHTPHISNPGAFVHEVSAFLQTVVQPKTYACS